MHSTCILNYIQDYMFFKAALIHVFICWLIQLYHILILISSRYVFMSYYNEKCKTGVYLRIIFSDYECVALLASDNKLNGSKTYHNANMHHGSFNCLRADRLRL